MAVSKPRLGRTRIGSIFWPCIGLGEPLFGYLLLKRYFSAIVKILYVVLLDTEPLSGSGSPIQHFCIGAIPECCPRVTSLVRRIYFRKLKERYRMGWEVHKICNITAFKRRPSALNSRALHKCPKKRRGETQTRTTDVPIKG